VSSAGPQFSLSYELRPEDLQQLVSGRARARRKDRRTRVIAALILFALFGVVFTVYTVALDLPSVGPDPAGAPSWMYAVDVLLWSLIIMDVRAAWRLSPARVARRAWERRPQIHGHHRDLVDQAGVTAVGPDGSWVMVPWANVRSVDETGEAFKLIGRDDATRIVLPKRGLPDPGSVPALREFLNRSVAAHSGERAEAAAATTADDPPDRPTGPGFSLVYQLQPGDVLAANRPQLNRQRERTEATIAIAGLGSAFFAWQTVGHGSSPAPGWMYVAGGVLVLRFLYALRTMWRLSPQRWARRAYGRSPDRHRRNLDLVGQRGVISIEPDGNRQAIPWSAVAKVEETGETFRLIDRHGVVREVLFKRAVPRPDLVPALRDFIDRSVASSRAAAGPVTDSAASRP